MMRHLQVSLMIGMLSLLLTACSEEAQPYEEFNETISTPREVGEIQTH